MSDEPHLQRRRLLQAGLAGLGLAATGTAAWLAMRSGPTVPEGEVLYDDRRFRTTDPTLVRYRETSRVHTGMLAPRALAFTPEGGLYLAGDRIVAVVGPDGRRRADIACPGEPRALALAPDGTLHVALRDRVLTIVDGTAGEPGPALPEDAQITGLAAHPRGDLYIADAGNRAVWRFRDGRQCGRLGGEGDDAFIIPSPYMDVQVAPDGLVWVANTGQHRLEAYDEADRRVRMWGTEGFAIERFCGCCNPHHFAVLPDGSFITSEKGIARVKRYAADGTFVSVVVPTEAFTGQPVGLDVLAGPDGRVFVLDPPARVVRVFAPLEGA